jgi:hypothetical protein
MNRAICSEVFPSSLSSKKKTRNTVISMRSCGQPFYTEKLQKYFQRNVASHHFLFLVLQTSGDGAQGAEQGHERPGEQHEAGAEVQQHHSRG